MSELAWLFHAVDEGSALESVALKAMFVSRGVLFQKPSCASKPKKHSTLLEQHLQLWHEGKIGDLVSEGCAIQSHLPCHPTSILILNWSGPLLTNAALITRHQHGGLLQLNNQIDPSNLNHLVHDILKEKHLPAQPLSQDLVSKVSESAPFHP